MNILAADEGAMSTKIYHGINLAILVSSLSRALYLHCSHRLLTCLGILVVNLPGPYAGRVGAVAVQDEHAR